MNIFSLHNQVSIQFSRWGWPGSSHSQRPGRVWWRWRSDFTQESKEQNWCDYYRYYYYYYYRYYCALCTIHSVYQYIPPHYTMKVTMHQYNVPYGIKAIGHDCAPGIVPVRMWHFLKTALNLKSTYRTHMLLFLYSCLRLWLKFKKIQMTIWLTHSAFIAEHAMATKLSDVGLQVHGYYFSTFSEQQCQTVHCIWISVWSRLSNFWCIFCS